jgi:fructokinase
MKRQLVLLGEALVDRLPSGPVAAGAPLNAARHLQALGCQPLLVSRIGQQDEDAERIQEAMQKAGLCMDGMQRDVRHASGAVDVLMQGTSHRFVMAANAAWDHIEAQQALAFLRGLRPQVLYFGTLAQRAPGSRAAIRAALEASAALRFLDLNLRDGVGDLQSIALASLELAHWVKVNDEELMQLQRWTGCSSAAELVARFALQRLIVTRGALGYQSFDAQGRCDAEGEGVPVANVVDTVGAGDAFSACLLAAHLHGRAWVPALVLANRFAAALCGQAGASTSDPASFYPPWQAAMAALPKEVA